MKQFAILITASIALVGCASSGVQVNEADIAHFQRGQTTYAEVVRQLGYPTTNLTLDDGSRVSIYSYAQVQARPETFIPIIGAFVGGADTKMTSVSLTFDQRGVLKAMTSSNSQLGTGTGLESGTAPNDRAADQPRQTSPHQ